MGLSGSADDSVLSVKQQMVRHLVVNTLRPESYKVSTVKEPLVE